MIIQSQWTMPSSTAPSLWQPAEPDAPEAAARAEADAALAAEMDAYYRAIRQSKAGSNSGAIGGKAMLPEPTHTPFAFTGAGTHVVIQGAQGYRIAVYSGIIYQGGDPATIRLLDGTFDLMGALTLMAGGVGLFLPWADVPYFVLQPGNSFAIDLSQGSGAYQVSGYLKTRALEAYSGA